MATEEEVLDQLLEDDTDAVEEFDEDDFLPAVGQGIFVPEKLSKLIQKRIEDTYSANQLEYCKWDAAFVQYRLCGAEDGLEFPEGSDYRYHMKSNADENIIRTNIRTLMRTTYMQNPVVEFTGNTPEDEKLAAILKFTISAMFNKQTKPGVNMKAKARRWILHGQLTNFGVLRLDYQGGEGSQEEAVAALVGLEEQLNKAKTKDEIKSILAKLEIAYDSLPTNERRGMSLVNVLPQYFLVDPEATQIDLSDAKWCAECFYENRDVITEKYYTKDEETGELTLRSNPKIKKRTPSEADEGELKDKIIETVTGHRNDEQRELLKKNAVLCWYYYDKILKRIYLFSTEDWSHPLYVWQDDMHLSRFFKHFILSFGEPVESVYQPGETSFYTGQVNEINRINREAKRIRDSIFNSIIYDSKQVDIAQVQDLITHLNNPGDVKAFGIGAGKTEGKVSELLEAFAPPAMKYPEVFETAGLRKAIDIAAATSSVERGEQFKTNTTNDAINFYDQIRQQTTGVTTDIIEEGLESLAWAMSEIIVSKYTKQDLHELIGEKAAEFTPMSVPEFNQKFRMKIGAGSIEKPNSQFKKKEALQVAQAIGQVGTVAPMTSMTLMMKLFQNAFDLNITQEEWELLKQEGMANLTKGQSVGQGTPEPAAAGPAPADTQ